MQEITIGKTYRHYKGNVYKIIALGRHSETLEDMVVYQSVETGEVWVRPKSMWNDKIPQDAGNAYSEADQSLQAKLVDKQLSADHLSTCVAPSPTIKPDFVTIFEFSFTYLRTSIEQS